MGRDPLKSTEIRHSYLFTKPTVRIESQWDGKPAGDPRHAVALPWKANSECSWEQLLSRRSALCTPSPLGIPMGTELELPGTPSTAWHTKPTPNSFSSPATGICHTDQRADAKHGGEKRGAKKKTTQAVVLTSSSWEGQVEKANFVLLVDSIYNPPFV